MITDGHQVPVLKFIVYCAVGMKLQMCNIPYPIALSKHYFLTD